MLWIMIQIHECVSLYLMNALLKLMNKVIYSAIDKNYLEPYKTMMNSLWAKGNVPDDVDYALFSGDVTSKDLESIPQNVRLYAGHTGDFRLDADGRPYQNCLLKIEAIEELSIEYNQALWLDSDILIQGDISELLVPTEYDLAAVAEFPYLECYRPMTTHTLLINKSIRINPHYFNSGVMVINLDTANRFINPLDSKMGWRDQEWLNLFYSPKQGARIKRLPIQYNWFPEGYGRLPTKTLEEHLRQRDNASIIHFAGKAKPWLDNSSGCNKYEMSQLEGYLK